MTTMRNFILSILVSSWAAASATAQEPAASRTAAPSSAVAVSTSDKGVRFAALGAVKQIRLEVFGEGGESVYNSDFQDGNVRDWGLSNGQGKPLPDGSYLCVVTFRDVSGRMGMKQGMVLVRAGRPSLRLDEGEQAAAGQEAATDAAGALTVTAHDGRDGQVVSTRGSLTFRVGDFFAGNDRELMRLTPEGNLGVGTSTPQATLDVAGAIRARGGIQFDDGTVQTSGLSGRVTADGTVAAAANGSGTPNRMAKWVDGAGTLGDAAGADTSGMVFFGQNAAGQVAPLFPTAPAAHVLEVGASGTKTPLVLAGGSSSMEFWRDLGGGTGAPQAAVAFGMARPGGSATNDIVFSTYVSGQPWNERLRLTSSGNLGVGTDSPQARLHVAGDIKVTGSAVVDGNIAAKYQDVAEWVPARESIAAGTVVTLDVTRTNAVTASTRAYDTHVAGVVSAQPGVILGEAGDGKVMVATTGRVKVRVDATRRPVRVGDLLVTSGRPGVAMRSLPLRLGRARLHRPGTIIGKALEPLANGQAEILVLLSLQ